ncbi:unnamed protein product [Linum trigynum]|uniref:Uncharacterized protein n=1 Tax=Linum trigynum TaxID=586398 RepID=A0AAV2GLB2_9ROSI
MQFRCRCPVVTSPSRRRCQFPLPSRRRFHRFLPSSCLHNTVDSSRRRAVDSSCRLPVLTMPSRSVPVSNLAAGVLTTKWTMYPAYGIIESFL